MILLSVIELLKKLVEIPSISPLDLGCQNIIGEILVSLGFKVEKILINKTSNLWAEHGKGKTFTFLGHTDVVPPGNIKNWNSNPFSLRISNNYVFGRGVVDMKGSIAAMIVAVRDFIFRYPFYKGRITFLITSDEESTGTDGTVKIVEKLIQRKEKIDFCLVGEPTSEFILGDVIKNGRRGSLSAQLIIYGVQGHIAYPHLFDNPIHKSILILQNLIKYDWKDKNEFFPSTQLQIYKINSSTNANNVIPGELKIEFNVRFNPKTTVSKIKSIISFLLDSSNLKYKLNWKQFSNPFYSKPCKLIPIVEKSINSIQKISTQVSTSGGTSDGRFFSNMNSEIVELGLINKTIHQCNERTSISDLKALVLIYKKIICNLFI
ncbi:Succinyl-diaminopimelate desuccinylase [Buchnera aphidicola (Tetraneura ulmi)]|uniref:succinyl-diaminopimelate desuccinylase n=1 Tax=Buchnera aphidicola TaxID=9 RepID=UPI003463DFBC